MSGHPHFEAAGLQVLQNEDATARGSLLPPPSDSFRVWVGIGISRLSAFKRLKRGCQGPGLSDSFGSGIVSALGGIRVSRLLVFVRFKMRMPGPGLVASLRPNGNMFHDARPGPAGLAAADLAS